MEALVGQTISFMDNNGASLKGIVIKIKDLVLTKHYIVKLHGVQYTVIWNRMTEEFCEYSER